MNAPRQDEITQDEYDKALATARQVAHQVTVDALVAELARAVAINARLVADAERAEEDGRGRPDPLDGERPPPSGVA